MPERIARLSVDCEVYKNYLLIYFERVDNGRSLWFEQYPGKPLDIATVKRVMRTYQTISFNGNTYDKCIIAYAITDKTNEQIKALSDALILGGPTGQGLRPWEAEREFNFKIPADWDHIDYIEVAPGDGSLKLYGARLHAPRLQDLPYDPDDEIDDHKRPVVVNYCGNDNKTLILLAEELKQQIELREKMSLEYGIDLRSKSDAQIAEAVIRSKVSALVGSPIDRPVIPPGTKFRYTPPPFLFYLSDEMKRVMKVVRSAEFVVGANGSPIMPPELADLTVRIGNSVYRMGIGGLHSSEKKIAHFSDADNVLIDRDVASYYPAIILNCELYPRHMGKHFLYVYRDIVNKRLEAKRAGNKVVADSLKITINGSFGKLGSKWSTLYSPDLMIQVTITGQLSLLMLIEMLESVGVPVVSANTDGIVMKCPRHLVGRAEAMVQAWENTTGFETEATYYSALYSRDVNSYLALKTDGTWKGKGAFTTDPKERLKKNPDRAICVEAVKAFLASGTPIEETVMKCRDIRMFIMAQKVTGGAVLPMTTEIIDHWEHDGEKWVMTHRGRTYKEKRKSRPKPIEVTGESRYLGKVVRWYRSTQSTTCLQTKRAFAKVPDSDNAMPVMDLPTEFPTDIDYAYYIEKSYEILKEIGYA